MSDQWSGRPPGDAALVDGWHWLRCNLHPAHMPEPWQWCVDTNIGGFWDRAIAEEPLNVGQTEYIGPLRTPAQHAAEIAEAEARGQVAGLLEAAEMCAKAETDGSETCEWDDGWDEACTNCSEIIRAAASARRETTKDSRDVG